MYSVFSLITIDFPKKIHKDVAYQSEENLNQILEKINDNSIVSENLYIRLKPTGFIIPELYGRS